MLYQLSCGETLFQNVRSPFSGSLPATPPAHSHWGFRQPVWRNIKIKTTKEADTPARCFLCRTWSLLWSFWLSEVQRGSSRSKQKHGQGVGNLLKTWWGLKKLQKLCSLCHFNLPSPPKTHFSFLCLFSVRVCLPVAAALMALAYIPANENVSWKWFFICIPPEEDAIASKACEIHVSKFVNVREFCPCKRKRYQ